MNNNSNTSIRDALERLTRLIVADDWLGELNPTQRAAIKYLTLANRFSRAPSQVAEYLATTRGTVSQTLKTLTRKGFVRQITSSTDKRWVSYEVTSKGRAVIENTSAIDKVIKKLNHSSIENLEQGLKELLREMLRERNNVAFGICHQCTHHQETSKGRFCQLLNEPLSRADSRLICHEFVA